MQEQQYIGQVAEIVDCKSQSSADVLDHLKLA